MEREISQVILRAVRRSEIQMIIDPVKLGYFISQEFGSMVDGDTVDLQILWDALQDAPGVNDEMIVQTFALIERGLDKLSSKVRLPEEVTDLPARVKEALLPGGEADPAAYRDEAPGLSSRMTISDLLEKEEKREIYGDDFDKEVEKRTAIELGEEKADESRFAITPLRVVIAVLLLVLGYSAYHYISTLTPTLSGKPVSASRYAKIIPVEEARLDGFVLHLVVGNDFLLVPDPQKLEKAFRVFTLARKKKIQRVILYTPARRELMTLGGVR